MASELVPRDFSLLKLMRVFADFREDNNQGLEPPANYSFMKKKKNSFTQKIVQLILQISLW